MDESSKHPMNDNDRIEDNKLIFLHLLYPNNEDVSAFDTAMVKKSPKSIEIMLEMFCKLDNLSLSRFFLHHFS